MGNNRLHALKVSEHVYLGVDASDKDSVHLLLLPMGLPRSEDDALEIAAAEILEQIMLQVTVHGPTVAINGLSATSYPLDSATLDILHASTDLFAKIGYRYQRARSLTMQAELPLGMG